MWPPFWHMEKNKIWDVLFVPHTQSTTWPKNYAHWCRPPPWLLFVFGLGIKQFYRNRGGAITWEHWVKIVQNQFCRPKLTKTSFFGQNPVFSAKIDENQVFLVKIGQNHFFGQNLVFSVKIDHIHFSRPNSTQTSFFLGQKPVFFRPTSTTTRFFGQKTIFSSQNPPEPLLSAKIDHNQFFWPKSTKA